MERSCLVSGYSCASRPVLTKFPSRQNAINNCNTPTNSQQMAGSTVACPYLTVNSATVAGSCKIKNVEVTEPNGIQGPLKTLPG